MSLFGAGWVRSGSCTPLEKCHMCARMNFYRFWVVPPTSMTSLYCIWQSQYLSDVDGKSKLFALFVHPQYALLCSFGQGCWKLGKSLSVVENAVWFEVMPLISIPAATWRAAYCYGKKHGWGTVALRKFIMVKECVSRVAEKTNNEAVRDWQ